MRIELSTTVDSQRLAQESQEGSLSTHVVIKSLVRIEAAVSSGLSEGVGSEGDVNGRSERDLGNSSSDPDVLSGIGSSIGLRARDSVRCEFNEDSGEKD